MLAEMRFDLAFIGAEGVNSEGLWNSQADVVKAQQAVIRRSKQVLVCVDSTKLGKIAPQFLAKWQAKLELISEVTPEKVRKLLR